MSNPNFQRNFHSSESVTPRKLRLTVECRIRPSDGLNNEKYQTVVQKFPPVEKAEEIENPSRNEQVFVREEVVEHISEDEKSSSSEEVVFEEWNEEFRCRRVDEIDPTTNTLIRTTYNPTSQPIKSDVLKEEYKERHQRIKGHKSYDVVKEVIRQVPLRQADPKKIIREQFDSPRSTVLLPSDELHRNQPWTKEEVYTTEIVQDEPTRQNIQSAIVQQRDPIVTEEYRVEIEQKTDPQRKKQTFIFEQNHDDNKYFSAPHLDQNQNSSQELQQDETYVSTVFLSKEPNANTARLVQRNPTNEILKSIDSDFNGTNSALRRTGDSFHDEKENFVERRTETNGSNDSPTVQRVNTMIFEKPPIKPRLIQNSTKEILETTNERQNRSTTTDYENLTNFRSNGQHRFVKPLVVNEIETIETKTHVDVEVQRNKQTEERTFTSSRRPSVTERAAFYESFKNPPPHPSPRNFEKENILPKKKTNSLEITPISPPSQIIFNTQSDQQMVAIVRIPELTNNNRVLTNRFVTSDQSSTFDVDRHSRSSRTSPSENSSNYSSSFITPIRSISSHRNSSDQQQQQQQQQQRIQKRPIHTGSLGNLLSSNLDFEIEIEKRPPATVAQPTRVQLEQPTRAIVTTSRDGRVTIENLAAAPGNSVVIHSDFHASDRSSGYVSADEIRSQIYVPNDSSDDQSKPPTPTYYPSNSTLNRRYRTQETIHSKLPSYYRPRSSIRANENFNRINEVVQRYTHSSSNDQRPDFHDTIDQIDALYNNLDVETKDQSNVYNFSKPPSTINRRKQLATNSSEYSKRYTSTGFQHVPSPDDHQRPLSDPESVLPDDRFQRTSKSLTDLVHSIPIQNSQSLGSSGILADYLTHGSSSPNSGYGSTQDIVYRNRYNDQAQVVRRNRTNNKQRTSTRRSQSFGRGIYSGDDDDDEDGHESPYSDHGGLDRQSSNSTKTFSFYP